MAAVLRVIAFAVALHAPVVAAQGNFQTAWCKSSLAIKPLSPDPVKASYDAFALRVHNQVVKGKPTANAVTSPASIHLAMSMAMAGAQGKTSVALMKTLAVPNDVRGSGGKIWFEQQALGLARLTCPTEYQTFTLRMANAMFGQQGKKFEAPFTKRLAGSFDAKPLAVDYAKNPEKARVTINDWVEAQTENKIRDLLAKGMIKESTKLTLVNALYLKAGWEQPFAPEKTRSRVFYLGPKSQIQVPMMEREGALQDYRYAKVGDVELVELGLGDGSIMMTLYVPTLVDGLAALEKSLNPKLVAEYEAALAARKVNLTLPKFNATGSFQLARVLKKLGAGLAFDPKKADFKGIDGGKDGLYISDVVHKTFIDVHEAGMEAAAATATTMKSGAAPPPPQEPVTVVVDRPFFFVVRLRADGVPLLMGRIVDPRASAG